MIVVAVNLFAMSAVAVSAVVVRTVAVAMSCCDPVLCIFVSAAAMSDNAVSIVGHCYF